MILRQFLHTNPAVAASYVFGCGSKRAGAVVDPIEEPTFYLDAAAALGLQVRYVIDTHVHADHLSTGPALATAAGGVYVLHESVNATFAFEPVRDGSRLELGNTSIEIRHLPGHTPEHIEVLPGAFAGSVSERGLSGKPTSTIGFERRFNKAFGIEDRQAFVDAMIREIPPQPPNAARNRAANLGLHFAAV